MQRRNFLQYLLGGAAVLLAGRFFPFNLMEYAMADDEKIIPVEKPDSEWRRELPPESYEVLRHEGTEAPFTSPLLNERHAGTFVCAGCNLPLFSSETKFDSGTGWPSFYDALPGHIAEKDDYKILMHRTEYHCARCGGHQGHVFNDGPKPTGLRYCNNGAALKFMPKKA